MHIGTVRIRRHGVQLNLVVTASHLNYDHVNIRLVELKSQIRRQNLASLLCASVRDYFGFLQTFTLVNKSFSIMIVHHFLSGVRSRKSSTSKVPKVTQKESVHSALHHKYDHLDKWHLIDGWQYFCLVGGGGETTMTTTMDRDFTPS